MCFLYCVVYGKHRISPITWAAETWFDSKRGVMSYRKLRLYHKTESPGIGRWLKWVKLKIKGRAVPDEIRELYAAGYCNGFHDGDE